MESSPEQWMNSWTCWTSGLALSKTEDLHLENLETLTTTSQRPSPVSSIPLHLAQKQGGLFDNEYAGKDDHAGTTFDLTNNIDVIDLGDDGSVSLDKLGGDVFDILETFASPNTSSPVNDDLYLNSFLDLSQFLLEDSQSAVDKTDTSAPSQGPVKVENPVKNALKRKLEEDVVVNVTDDVMEMEQSPANIDHDYVSKKPRTISEVEDEELPRPASSQKNTPKYRARREKNNVASKRSREIRKQKFAGMELEAEKLVVENDKLRIKIAELEQLTKEMKATLISKMVGNK